MLKAVIYDCDGVILESAMLKTDAYRTVLAEYGDEAVDEFIQYHTAHAGLSRCVKFEWFLSRHAIPDKIPNGSAAEKERLINAYTEEVRKRIFTIPAVPGAVELLEWASPRVSQFLISGTPHNELIEIIEKRGLARYFLEIAGSPADKAATMIRLQKKYDFAAGEAVYVGDAISDRDAAREAGVHFVARMTDYNKDELASGGYPKVRDMNEFRVWIQSRLEKNAGGA